MPAIRDTVQRRAISEVIDHSDRPLTIEEILRQARKSKPSLGIATVYRTINTLVADHVIVPIQVPDQPVRYERANIPHHHHFHCNTCGKVFDVQACPEGLRRMLPTGFELESHEVVLYGRCRNCCASG